MAGAAVFLCAHAAGCGVMIHDASFFLPGGKAGVLLIHGLTGTPNEMQILGRGLHRAGFTVYGVQLAGHCGDNADLVKTGWQDWYRSVEQGAQRMFEHVDTLFAGGLSMGAVLALKLAAEHADAIRGVGVYGPTFFMMAGQCPVIRARWAF